MFACGAYGRLLDMKFCRIINSLLLFVAVFFTVGIQGARAQEALEIRINDLEGYTRVVFDWPEKPGFTAQKNDSTLTVTFDKAAAYQAESLNAQSFRNVKSINFSAGENSATATLMIASEATYRNFSIGNRVIVDVYDSAAPSERAEETPPASAATAPETEAPSQDELATDEAKRDTALVDPDAAIEEAAIESQTQT